MNCPHVNGRVRHETPTTNGTLKGGQKSSGTLQSLPSTLRGQHRPPETFICAVCKSRDSPWLCLDCGSIHCGRYVKGHAKAHYKDKKHCISVDCYCLTAFCYICDSYIQKDVIPQPIIQRLILNLNSIHNGDSYSETSESTEEEEEEGGGDCENSTEISPEGCVNNVCDNKIYGDGGPRTRSGINSASEAIGPASNHRRRRRRVGRVRMPTSMSKNPRKRICGAENGHPPHGSVVNGHSTNQCSVSDLNGMDGGNTKKIKLNDERDLSSERNGSASTSAAKRTNTRSKTGGVVVGVKKSGRTKENDATLQDLTKTSKHGVVGLRNLGNTCFMNAVLQSLSKIHGFSRYLSHIPPPDELNPSQFANPKPKYSTRSQKKALLSYKNSIKASTLGLCSSPSDTIEIPTTEEFLTNELRKILIMLNTKGSSAVSPNGLFTVIWEVMPRFRGYQQQDAHEFLRYMLDRIHCELVHLVPKYSWNHNNLDSNGRSNGVTNGNQNGVSNNNSGQRDSYLSSVGYKESKSKSIVTSMFGGILQNEVRCCRCGSESKKNDPFLDLSLDIPCPPGGMTKLEDCLSRFIDIEELSDDDLCFCSNCKTHQKCTKRFWISHLPSVLCLHLKRFRFSSSVRSKLDHYVQFPMKSLDMSEYILTKCQKKNSACKVYDLSAVIVHHGTGVGSGHYTAYAKKDVQWYHFNDSSVKPAEESAVAKCKAYILFYTHSDGEIKT